MLAGLRRQWPIAASLGVVLVGLVVVGMGHFRRGTVLLSFGITLALFLRILLSQDDAGMLAVRSKKVDVLVLAVLAVGTSLLSLWVPPPSN
ncbi:MAG TPA: DUF3017 domain-containing protein [Candidatus Nanopelagicales bacterium]|nr:DUF3017 domain-containing protein [Candidatus Nanopelagicales bacterium]